MTPDDEIDLLALHTVGGRLTPERSRALPAQAYRNPLDSIKLRGDREQAERKKARPGKRDKQ